MKSLQCFLQKSNGDLQKINGSILSGDNDVNFIEQMEKIAADDGLSATIDSLSVEDAPADWRSGRCSPACSSRVRACLLCA